MNSGQPPSTGGPSFRPAAGQTLMFLGDHTSPDHPGYLSVVSDVVARFHPDLHLRLISAGSAGQTAAGFASRAMLDLLGSSRPDYVVATLGLADAQREPGLVGLLREYRRRTEAQQEEELGGETLGPLTAPSRRFRGPVSDSGQPPAPPPTPEPNWQRLSVFAESLDAGVSRLASAGVTSVLVTPLLVGADPLFPLNVALRAYARAVRLVAQHLDVPLVDFGQACRDLIDRAANYKQSVEVASLDGKLNPQGEALLARTFLGAAGLLPGPGHRRLR